MKISRPDSRTSAARISRRHGSWFIHNSESNETDGTTTPDELFDCASSVRVAKRIARKVAVELGWSGPFTWVEDPDSVSLVLLATDNDGVEYDDEVDDDG